MHNLVVYTTDQYLIRKYAEISPIGFPRPIYPTIPFASFFVTLFGRTNSIRYKSDKRSPIKTQAKYCVIDIIYIIFFSALGMPTRHLSTYLNYGLARSICNGNQKQIRTVTGSGKKIIATTIIITIYAVCDTHNSAIVKSHSID